MPHRLPAANPTAIGLALPYTPVGRVERFTPLPPSFYGWVAATVLGELLMCISLGWTWRCIGHAGTCGALVVCAATAATAAGSF